MDKLTFEVSEIGEHRLCVEVKLSGMSGGLLYFERAKKTYNTKPVSMDRWVCVDANVKDIYVYGSMEIEHLTPKVLMEWALDFLKSEGY